ncbi:putative zinc-binding metallopeptidase [Archangium lipolyticum]|uniref:putative zinc-binding metallopeptidase n=1 Tax=Archangium lipolyticum TaxID=2970465 RepID=UPI00214A81D5|nr:putative zinc-binding metallopeptidase [Archangium lipolyticum]
MVSRIGGAGSGPQRPSGIDEGPQQPKKAQDAAKPAPTTGTESSSGSNRAENRVAQSTFEGTAPAKPRPQGPDESAAIQKDPKFKRLDDGLEKEILARMEKLKGNPIAQDNLSDLVKSDGFSQLSLTHQRQMLETLDKAPSNRQLAHGLRDLAGDASFRKLNSDTSTQLLGALGRHPNDVNAQKNLTALALSPGFGQLNAAHQKQALAALDRAPADAKLLQDVQGLTGSDKFRNLNDAVKSTALEQLALHPKDDPARNTLVQLAGSPGFQGLADADKQKLLRYVGGTNVEISTPARRGLDTLLSSDAYKKADAAGQRTQLQQFLTDQPATPGLVDTPAGSFDTKRLPYKLNGPSDVKDFDFRSGKADAIKYEVEVDGKKIPVYMPKTPDKSAGVIHSIDEVAKGLAALPASSRALVKQVVVDGKQNPDDAYWARTYNDPNFRSYMTAGAEGSITVYPSQTKMTQDYLDGTMIHETGHTLSMQKWGSQDSDKRWDDWKAAAKSDGLVASGYAKASPGEDFAETLLIYQQAKGTPREAEFRAMMPERFKIIDELLAGKR